MILVENIFVIGDFGLNAIIDMKYGQKQQDWENNKVQVKSNTFSPKWA